MNSFILLFLAACTFALNAQSSIYSGNYDLRQDADNGDFREYKITLNPNSTFIFHSHSFISKGIPPEIDTFGKGTWKAEKNIISFTTDEVNDLDIVYSLDFSNTKARYDSKSTRDLSDRIIPTNLKIYRSDIPWISGKELLKSK